MRIAFIDHSYHEKTASNVFLRDMLAKHGTLEIFYDYSWIGGETPDLPAIMAGGYDMTVVFQMENAAAKLKSAGCRNLVFVPMWDGCQSLHDDYWKRLAGVRIVSFSRFLHQKLARLGCNSAHFQYLPDPSQFEAPQDFSNLRGFFWQRRREIAWPHISALIGAAQFSAFQLHGALDPGCGDLVMPPPEDMDRHGVRITRWFDKRADFNASLLAANIVFAPRIAEGIGMSFLEAMAMGMCVAAPDRPTMNEYIRHGVNGLLYDPDNPRPLNFSKARQLGLRARETAERGHERWSRDLRQRLPDFIFGADKTGDALLYDYGAHDMRQKITSLAASLKPVQNAAAPETFKGGARPPGRGKQDMPGAPLVSIVTVVKNAADVLEQTLLSSLAQDYPNKEIIVADARSTDGTLEIIRNYDSSIDVWISEKDNGPFFAMNKAIAMARGRWVLFMNAGDIFYAGDTLSRAISGAPEDADFLVGHHVYRTPDGDEILNAASDFEDTWSRLCAGEVGIKWLQGIPCHQATLTSAELLRANAYNTVYRIAADHELLYRMRRNGARFHHTNEIIAVYAGGGLSLKNHVRCVDEWWKIARGYGPVKKVNKFFLKAKGSLVVDGRRNRSFDLRIATTLGARALRPEKRDLSGEIKLIKQSGLLFEIWYLNKNPDVAIAEMPPIKHYLLYGALEGRNPSPFFDTDYYQDRYADVRESGMNPLVHYLLHGYREHRSPNPWFTLDKHMPEMKDKPPATPAIIAYIAKLARTPAL